MQNLANIPLSARLGILFAVGTLLAGLLNLAIYRLAWNQRTISPWGPAPPGAAPRGWLDRLPIIGWLRLSRETGIHGRGFWIRPLLVELFCGLGLAALYWWEVEYGLFHEAVSPEMIGWFRMATPRSLELVHQQFLAHVILFALMLVATFIDIDEKSIPDEITVSGTLLALVLAAVMPWSLLPGEMFIGPLTSSSPPALHVEFLHVASPGWWPLALDGLRPLGLALGLLCYLMWCFALLPRIWHGRYGARRALRYFLARIVRDPSSRIVAVLAVLGTAGITGVWVLGGPAWAGLFTALVGMAAGGGIVWVVRLIAYAVMRKEAMGFGDVTLMAMIGAFCGWQASLIIFLLAPLAGLVIGLAHLALRRGQVIPYGPFLCLATAVVVVFWASVWDAVYGYFATLGWLIPVIAVFSLAAMGGLLWLLQGVKRLLRIGEFGG